MTTTMATTVANVRRILQDNPDEDYLTDDITTTTQGTVTVNDVSKWQKGNIWEFADGEQILVRTVDPDTDTVTFKRGHHDSTAATHAADDVAIKSPRYTYDLVGQAVQTSLDTNLFNEGVYEIEEHSISSSTTSLYYNAPTTECEEFLWVYQVLDTGEPPISISDFDRIGKNVDTAIWGNGKVFGIRENQGIPGTDPYYVNCKHKLSIDTVSTSQERIVQFLACAYLLEWTEPRRLGGPNNQGDTTVKPGMGIQDAAYFRRLASEAIANERAYLRALVPPFRNFRKFT